MSFLVTLYITTLVRDILVSRYELITFLGHATNMLSYYFIILFYYFIPDL